MLKPHHSVPRDCVAAESAPRQRSALRYLESVLGIDTRAARPPR